MSQFYSYTVNKCLYSTDGGVVAGIYDKRVNDAIRNRQLLRITCEGITNTFNPKWIRKHCKKFEKVYRRPDEPMVEYEVFLRAKPKLSNKDLLLRAIS